MYRLSVAVLLITYSMSTLALSIMEINTEFLWDNKTPHEGRLAGKNFRIPSHTSYMNELQFYKTLIEQYDADLVGLIEIEGCHVAFDLATTLGSEWDIACKTGRDSYTGQDVALLTRLPVISKSITNHSKSYYNLNGMRSRPSKVLTTIVGSGNNTYSVTVAHLISKRGNNDAKRLAQAQAIARTVKSHAKVFNPKHIIVMGDLNDTVDSDVVEAFRYADVEPSEIGSSCSYIYRGQCKLIDHVLVSNSLLGGYFKHIDVPKKYSDHHAVHYKF